MSEGKPAEASPAPNAPVPLLRTPLYPFHVARNAHLVPFNGWEMPLYYRGIVEEHAAVRTSAGLFDVAHMGLLLVGGASAPALLARRTTANVPALAPGQCRYTFWLDSSGRIVDDLLVTRLHPADEETPRFLVVPNAGRAAEIQELLQQHRKPDTTVERLNGRAALLAVQGPRSREVLESTFGWSLRELKFYHARLFPKAPGAHAGAVGRVGAVLPKDLGDHLLVSRTGYTGELGYELLVPGAESLALAERLEKAGVVPAGLGARNTLRLEKGYLLSGQEFHRDRTPLEAGQDRFVEFDHAFVGREALERQRTEGLPARLVGIRVDGDGIPRDGTPVLSDGAAVATCTSGGLSLTLKVGIALAYLPPKLAEPGTALELDIRSRKVPARVVPLPFLAAAPARR